MKHSIRSGIRTVATAFALAALFTSTTALPLAAPTVAKEYKVQYKLKKSGYRSVRMLGNSPYICIPSGFGQKGRCYLRSAA